MIYPPERLRELQRILAEGQQTLTLEETAVFARDVVSYFRILEAIARRVDREQPKERSGAQDP